MTIAELAKKARSVRRFDTSREVSRELLLGLVDAARLAPCGANLQELRYSVIDDEGRRDALFPLLRWAAYLRDWEGPAPAERPASYIVIHSPASERPFTRIDAGIAAGYASLAARESGLGCCIILSFDREAASAVIGSPPETPPLLVLALGYPGEEVVLETLEPGGSVEYWRDPEGRHHVPKRRLQSVLIRADESPGAGKGTPPDGA